MATRASAIEVRAAKRAAGPPPWRAYVAMACIAAGCALMVPGAHFPLASAPPSMHDVIAMDALCNDRPAEAHAWCAATPDAVPH